MSFFCLVELPSPIEVSDINLDSILSSNQPQRTQAFSTPNPRALSIVVKSTIFVFVPLDFLTSFACITNLFGS